MTTDGLPAAAATWTGPGDRPDVDVSCGDGGQEMAEGEFPCQVHIVRMPHRVAPRPAPISMTVYRFSSLAISRSQCAPIQSLFGHLFGLRFATFHGRGKWPRPLDTGESTPRQRRRKGERRPHPGRADRRRCGRYASEEGSILRRGIRRLRRDIHTGYRRAERGGAWLTTPPQRAGSNPRGAEPRRERAGPGRPARRAYRKRFEPGAGPA